MAFTIGFVDDTNILTFSKTTEDNCKALEAAHKKCIEWASRHGAQFAPEKYQLIHFTRKRKKHNLKATVNIEGFNGEPEKEIRLLGVWVDTKLNWGPHIKRAQRKGITQMASITKLCKSTWGATFHKARHLYTAIVRPAMLYGCQIWHNPLDKHKGHSEALEKVQSQALRTMLGAYKSSPTHVLRQEAGIPPISQHASKLTLDHVLKSNNSTTVNEIEARCLEVAKIAENRKRRKTSTSTKHYHTRRETLTRALQRGGELSDLYEANEKRADSRRWTHKDWRTEWREAQARRAAEPQTTREPTAWKPPWRMDGHRLHSNLTRAQSTIATQLRTGHIGLRQYLYKRRVPEVDSPFCECGEGRQDVKHILLTCPRLQTERIELTATARTTNLDTMLSTPQGLKAAANWILKHGILEGQFKLVRETGIGNLEKETGEEQRDT